MAQKLGFFDQLLFGEWADRAAINRHAEDLSRFEVSVSGLQAAMQRQGQEILLLRATIMGLVEVLHTRSPIDEAELQAAWGRLLSPPPPPVAPSMTDPYRGMPGPAPAPRERMILGPQCGRRVPASRTNITEHGEVCDACS
jgi:hypothetical protein